MINDIYEKLGESNEGLLYADDAVIWRRGRNISYINDKIQKGIHILEQWGVGVLNFQSHNLCTLLEKKIPETCKVMLYNLQLERSDKFKYLGIWLDTKLTWKYYIEYIETNCKKVINFMRMVTGHSWGADRQSLIYIYKALIRSIIDYGCIVYSSACKTSLNKIERMQFKVLRIALGAFKRTPALLVLY